MEKGSQFRPAPPPTAIRNADQTGNTATPRDASWLPLGDTRMCGVACMLNWVGEMPDAAAVLGEPGGHWHDYGKLPRDGRKVGHATLREDSRVALASALTRVGGALGRMEQVAPVIARLPDGT